MSDHDPLAPRQNPDLVGQEAAERELYEAFHGPRMAHAWLLCGSRGIGKATLAYRFARYVLAASGKMEGLGLFADEPVTGQSGSLPGSLYVAPEDPVFQRVAAGGHADLKTVVRTPHPQTGKLRGEIVVDDTREIGPFLRLTAAEGGWRVVVIDCADELNRSSANAVLKILEEPPERALLLLVSHNPGRLLATIRSRCRHLAVPDLDDDVVAKLFRQHDAGVSEADLAILVRLAEGSIGRAIGLAGAGGLELYGDVMDLLETLPRLDSRKLHDFGGRLARRGAEDAFTTATELLTWWLGRQIRAVAGGGLAEAGGGPVDDRERHLFGRLEGTASLDRWLQVWEKISGLLARTEGANLDRKQVVLSAFLAIEDTVRP